MAKNNDILSGAIRPRICYTINIEEEHAKKLEAWLDKHLWTPCKIDYSVFAYKSKDVNIVLYTSGKLVIQGKGTEDFVRFVLEGEITKQPKMGYEAVEHPEWFEAHAGMDESGKGDLFGPLVCATVIADKEAVQHWIDSGIKESKLVTNDNTAIKMAKIIKETKNVVVKVSYANMEKYNTLYIQFGRNLNKLLAWMHAQAIKGALAERQVPWGLLDQFTKQPLVQNQLKGIDGFELKMQTKAESDPVVAAASIIARATYIHSMRKLSEECGIKLEKGSSAGARSQAVEIIKKFGPDALKRFAKLHFKTAAEALEEAKK